MPVKDYNADPDLNTQISGINIAEGCAPSGINNAIRQLMADVKVESEADTSLRALIAEEVAKAMVAANAAQSSADAAQSSADAAQNSADAKLPLDGNKSFTLRGTNTSYTFSVNNSATALQITAKDSDEAIKCVLFLNGQSGRVTARVYNGAGDSKDFYLNPETWTANWAGSKIVTEGSGSAYSTVRTPNTLGVAFSGSSYTLPAGGSWSAFFVDTTAAYCGGWVTVAGGTALNLGVNKQWRGLIARNN